MAQTDVITNDVPTPGTADPAPATQQTTPPDNSGQQQQAQSGISQEDMGLLLEKARKDEKGKLYPEIERLKALNVEADAKHAELKTLLETRQQELEGVRAGKVEQAETVNRELRESRDKITDLEATIKKVAEDSAARLHQSEMTTYREKRLREAGIKHLDSLVTGNTIDEIEESLKAAEKQEKAIYEKARAEERAKLAEDLPQPLAPDGSQSRTTPTVTDPAKRVSTAQLPASEYQKIRAALMVEAKQKAGRA